MKTVLYNVHVVSMYFTAEKHVNQNRGNYTRACKSQRMNEEATKSAAKAKEAPPLSFSGGFCAAGCDLQRGSNPGVPQFYRNFIAVNVCLWVHSIIVAENVVA